MWHDNHISTNSNKFRPYFLPEQLCRTGWERAPEECFFCLRLFVDWLSLYLRVSVELLLCAIAVMDVLEIWGHDGCQLAAVTQSTMTTLRLKSLRYWRAATATLLKKQKPMASPRSA